MGGSVEQFAKSLPLGASSFSSLRGDRMVQTVFDGFAIRPLHNQAIKLPPVTETTSKGTVPLFYKLKLGSF